MNVHIFGSPWHFDMEREVRSTAFDKILLEPLATAGVTPRIHTFDYRPDDETAFHKALTDGIVIMAGERPPPPPGPGD